MHVHGSHMNLNSANLYSAAGAEKAAAASRAAETRKKLLKSAGELDGVSGSEEGSIFGHWMDSAESQPLNQGTNQGMSEDEYHPGTTGRDPDFG
jgi:hypothetical protein